MHFNFNGDYMNFYDMHSHILPAVDDGSKSVDMSLRLINLHLKQGVNNICLTPHYYSNEESIQDFLERRNKSFELLKPNLPENVNVCLGSEVFVTNYMFNNNDFSMLCYGNSKYMLTEFAYQASFSGKSMDMLVKLKENYGIIPVIPHIERYEKLFINEHKLEELTQMGVIIQTNAYSFNSFLKKRYLCKLINNGLIHILGTDAHSMSKGNPTAYKEACNIIIEKCGRARLNKMQAISEDIFNKSN